MSPGPSLNAAICAAVRGHGATQRLAGLGATSIHPVYYRQGALPGMNVGGGQIQHAAGPVATPLAHPYELVRPPRVLTAVAFAPGGALSTSTALHEIGTRLRNQGRFSGLSGVGDVVTDEQLCALL